jgi:hypothetical protein
MDFCVSELWIHRDLKQKGFTVKRSGIDINVQFPPFPDVTGRAEELLDIVGATGTTQDPEQFVIITRLHVVMQSEEEKVATFKVAAHDAVSNHQRRCLQVATDLVTEFLDWLRVRGQYWLGVMGERPERCGALKSFDAITGERFRAGFGGLMMVQARAQAAMLTASGLDEIHQDLAMNRTFPNPESFLADALHLREAEHRSDIQRAIIMAAVACETKVQQILREKVSDDRKGLVLIILKNHREIEIAKIMLFHTVMAEALGCSLRDSNQELYERIESLFKMRNRIVHEGKLYSVQEMRPIIVAAKEVFEWLDAIPPALPVAATTVVSGTVAAVPSPGAERTAHDSRNRAAADVEAP